MYASILIEEAKRRGIQVSILDEALGLFRLSYEGEAVTCRESLTDRTSAIAYMRCDDKRLTHAVLQRAGIRVPRQQSYRNHLAASRFLRECEALVVKPLRGEQGRGITVDIRTDAELRQAVRYASEHCDDVLLEEYVDGRDTRIIVIDHRFVAAIERTPASVTGDGKRTIQQLIQEKNELLAEQTAGESRIPWDSETVRVLAAQGRDPDDVLAPGATLPVRKTANYHTGGTIRDVTEQISPYLREIAKRASLALEIPVVGFDFLIRGNDEDKEDYVVIEANERPGLANHEPQPTARIFIDFLFPSTREIV
ncbi:ATP-grasp domain-containing protein [Brevibacillus humidisoli]|uniref:ATP-grasp domain-containing protein n=1 Tax=Brevibacillus humidisoli TaxID=2895522 RepID=UPI001E5CD8B0|nr:ATP-grasp domain-containing protein [Brevibacillus humidisoli]UFJ43210.1 ATP-grasp domain-containing protein [Brevibacillus humidisoli]